MTREELSAMVQDAMKRAKWSYAEWGRAINRDPATVRSWATGQRTPEPESCRALATGLREHIEQAQAALRVLETAAGREGE